jgi:exosome complex RNA-binding protein Rrp42 (RNase PH superfamily)
VLVYFTLDIPHVLIIQYTTQVWHLRLTLHFLADAGNLLDCACLAGIVALKHFRRPDVEVIGDEVTVVCLRIRLATFYLYESPLARPFRTCARSVSHSPHTILFHLRLLR